MLKISVRLRILLTIILIILPIGIISFFFSKKIFKKLAHLLGKIDTFDALIRVKRQLIHFYRTKISHAHSHLRKTKFTDTEYNQQIPTTNIDEQSHDSISQQTNFDFDDTLDNNQEARTLLIKKKKLIEKIIYEALGYRKDGKFDEYEKKIIEGLAIDSEDKDLNKLLADLYFTMGNYKKALPTLRKIVDIDPNDHKAIWQIGEIYLTSSDFTTAETLIKKAININPTNPKYYISMVELLYNTDRRHDAIVEMEKIIKLRPTNSAYMLTLAELYQEVDDIDNAKKYYFRVLEYEPSNEKAKKKLNDLVV